MTDHSGPELSEDDQLWETLSNSGSRTSDKDIGQDLDTQRGRQDLKLRVPLFWIVMILMVLEVIAMFVIVIAQGVGSIFGMEFKIDQWALAAIEAGVLLQTFGIVQIITHALFKKQ